MENKNTTITVKESTWLELNKRKRLGESMDDLIVRMVLETPEVPKQVQLQMLRDKFPSAYSFHIQQNPEDALE